MTKVIVGVNDLKTKFPDIAAEAYGWDPRTVGSGTHQKKDWRCNKGHTWDASVKSRTSKRGGCPFCSGNRFLTGFNDLQTRYPEIAKEAYGWDPTTVNWGTALKKKWICKLGHIWDASVSQRTQSREGKWCGTGCPVCRGKQIVTGFNDLQTRYPEIAKEAYGWDPTTVAPGTHKEKTWKCNKGHIWKSSINTRTNMGCGCPVCFGTKILQGYNDLQTRYPEIAKEAYGWDPNTVVSGHQRKTWICKLGHIWNTKVNTRTIAGRGCPVCCGQKIVAGFNDLQTKFPEIAKEAYGWDPTTVAPGNNKKKKWICKLGHIWDASANSRMRGDGCSVCSGMTVLAGFNDLKTKFPDTAAEAYGWDPTTVVPGTHQEKTWRCNKGHTWKVSVKNRTSKGGTGCPVCSSMQVLVGFNDLKTRFPDIAAEAYEWDPSTVVAGTAQKKDWKCKEGHIYHSTVVGRTSNGNGCPICAEYGFNPEKDAWFYLMQRPGEQQLGISNVITDRLRTHESNGWTLLEHTAVPSKGQKVLDTEKAFKTWLRKEIGLMEGTTENWSTSKMEVQSLAELKARSGIETDLF